MNGFRPILFVLVAAALGACTTVTRNEIEGNNTGGVIPGPMIKGGNVASLAGAHCAKYGTNARITFEATQTGGDVVFVCEAPALSAPSTGKQAPAKQQPPGGTKQAPRAG
ncbi:MAG: hypothetical protein WD871_10560 [Xanthobacteraceae bacterium]